MATNKATPKDPKQDEEFDWYEVMGKRMAEGKDVGENYLYGREAVELIRRKLVDEETMRLYRSAAFFARKEIQTEASALEWEAEAKARHQAAKEASTALAELPKFLRNSPHCQSEIEAMNTLIARVSAENV